MNANSPHFCQPLRSSSEQRVDILQAPAQPGLACHTMAISVSLGSANSNGFEDPEERKSSESDEIWRSGSSITIPAGPSADILSYTFANLGQYDQDKPVSPVILQMQ